MLRVPQRTFSVRSITLQNLIKQFFPNLLAVCLIAMTSTARASGVARFVDPLIGSGGHGHVFVGASVPFGAVQVGPNNFHQGWDWCSGYHYSDDVVVGFSHLHLSGTGIPDLGDVLIQPYTGELQASPGTRQHPELGYASRYSHERESVRPGYYCVDLLDYDVQVELTATERVGMHRYRFPGTEQARIVIDLVYENGGGRAVESSLRRVDAHTLVGYRKSTGWAKDQRVYFAVKSSQPFDTFDLFDGPRRLDSPSGKGSSIRGVLSFPDSPREVLLKVGISPVSEENAEANIEAEVPGWRFDAVARAAEQKWEQALGVVQADSADDATKRVFYTALYHTLIAPVLFNDANGQYRGADKLVHERDGFDNYSIFSLWDTYRAAHPLYTLVQPKRVDHFVRSMLAICDQQGKLPVWHLLGNETDTMVGYHAVPVIIDAYLKGLTTADAEKIFQASRASAMRDDRGLNHIKERGYIPSDKLFESVALAMEYAIDDWCIAQMAGALGKHSDQEYFANRAGYYKNYFDTATKFMRGKTSDGSWREPFDPFTSSHRQDDYCEGNGWQYLWLTPQDPEGLIKLLGGDESFTAKLDLLFSLDAIKTEGASADISGLIGQYAHGNEPSHHTVYMYAYAGKQWKTAALVRQILSTLYSDQPDGLSGNEDCGQMSAWYVLSSLGFYPVNPAAGIYVFGSPLLDRATISLPDGKAFTIIAENGSPENMFIQSVRLNGEPYSNSYIRHSDIVAGGELLFIMGPEPNREFGAAPNDRPESRVYAR